MNNQGQCEGSYYYTKLMLASLLKLLISHSKFIHPQLCFGCDVRSSVLLLHYDRNRICPRSSQQDRFDITGVINAACSIPTDFTDAMRLDGPADTQCWCLISFLLDLWFPPKAALNCPLRLVSNVKCITKKSIVIIIRCK